MLHNTADQTEQDHLDGLLQNNDSHLLEDGNEDDSNSLSDRSEHFIGSTIAAFNKNSQMQKKTLLEEKMAERKQKKSPDESNMSMSHNMSGLLGNHGTALANLGS